MPSAVPHICDQTQLPGNEHYKLGGVIVERWLREYVDSWDTTLPTASG